MLAYRCSIPAFIWFQTTYHITSQEVKKSVAKPIIVEEEEKKKKQRRQQGTGSGLEQEHKTGGDRRAAGVSRQGRRGRRAESAGGIGEVRATVR